MDQAQNGTNYPILQTIERSEIVILLAPTDNISWQLPGDIFFRGTTRECGTITAPIKIKSPIQTYGKFKSTFINIIVEPFSGDSSLLVSSEHLTMSEKQTSSEISHPRIQIIRHLWRIIFTAAVIATMFTIFTPLGMTFGIGDGIEDIFLPPSASEGNQFFPTPTDRPRPRVGIVVGHWGRQDDMGAVCPDGLSELDVNLDVASLVQKNLREEGFAVDLLKENDERLPGYEAIALVSVHADTCVFYNLEATGFKVAAALATARPDKANRLVACVYSRYSEATRLPYHAGVTDDMSSYHAFEEIHSETAAVIIETGFLNLDRQILTQQPNLIAKGISDGILCYIRNEDASPPSEVIP